MANKTQAQIRREVRNFYKISGAQSKAFGADLKRIYSKIFNKTTRGINRENYIERMGYIIQGMKDLGLNDSLKELKKNFTAQYKDAEEYYRNKLDVPRNEPSFGLGKEEVAALIRTRLDAIGNSIFDKIPEIQSIIQTQIITGEYNWSALDNLADDYGGETETITKTAMATFYRVVNVGTSTAAGIYLFYYEGPEDAKNRDFCFDLLQKDPPIYTLDEISKMDNDQDLDVFTSGGGWNCRHQWLGVTEEEAESWGYQG